MLSYLYKILILVLFSLYIIYLYYNIPFHVENFDGYFTYVAILVFIFSIYKYIQIDKWWNKVVFTPFNIFIYFILQLFVLSLLFFVLNWQPFWWGIILFFKILLFSFFPVMIVFISISFGMKILSILEEKNIHIFLGEDNKIFNFILSLWIWFFSFMFVISIFWLIWFYNLLVIFSVLILFLWFSLKEFWEVISWIFSYKFEFDSHNLESDSFIKNISLKLLSTEFLFLIWTFLLSINLINVIRPFPIWWDDLWSYMNIAKTIAQTWNIWSWLWIISWQTFTWIWYLFKSPTLAFIFNNVGGVLSFIVITLTIWDLLKSSKKELWEKSKLQTFINIPLLVSTIFISMPMVIFQQAKDMKLDPGLFFISVITIYIFYKVVIKYINYKDDNNFNHKQLYFYFLLIWILCWFAFTIKFTSLMLILWIIGVLFYSKLGISWFFGYLWIFFAIFTKAKLWNYMNVVYPKDDVWFITNFSIISFIIWILFLTYSFHNNKIKNIKYFFSYIIILLLWILIPIFPWVLKNISSTTWNITVWAILFWSPESYKPDFTKLHTTSEIKLIEKKQELFWAISSSGKTQNEDLGRYFWYENGINNYIKLPYNLTMQSNQNWEFTDITFIFLAIIPFLLLFLPFRNRYYFIGTGFFIILELLFILWSSESVLSKLMSNIITPFWYIFILWQFIVITLLLSKWLKHNKLNEIFNLNMVFISVYVFLWTISAFWIVWYWILMYYSFLLIIAIWWYYLSNYNEELPNKEITIRFFGSFVLLFIVSVYFFNSTFPHWFSNLKSASYLEYKTWKLWSDEAVFAYHPDYLKTLFELNIKKQKQNDFIMYSIESSEIRDIIKTNKYFDISIVDRLLQQIEQDSKTSLQIKQQAKKSRLNIYSWILTPKNEYKSDAVIFRLGTFLKYFINDNNARLYEDGLITSFDLYLYDKDPNKTAENMKKLWLSYLLVDLNAATIDQDSRHDLTRRYENLLKTYTSDKLELVETDSICLQIALEDYKKSAKKIKDMDDYVMMAWVNHESYTQDWKTVNRSDKLTACYNKILKLYQEKKIDDKNYSYLLPIQQYLSNPDNSDILKSNDSLWNFFVQSVRSWYKVLFKIK